MWTIANDPPRLGIAVSGDGTHPPDMHLAFRELARRVVPGWIRSWRADRFRSRVSRVTERVVEHADGIVRGGPFKGMRYVGRSHCSQLAPKLLGTYELEVRGVVDEMLRLASDRIVDVGAAEGYYAVGLLRLAPDSRIVAFEAEAPARAALHELAALNGVTDRLDVRGLCDAGALTAALAGAARPVVVMDIEGAERDVLDPESVPHLRRAHVLVELHPHLVPDIRERLSERFRPSHRVEFIPAVARGIASLPSGTPFGRRDLLAAVWEGRPDGQGWLWMTPRHAASSGGRDPVP